MTAIDDIRRDFISIAPYLLCSYRHKNESEIILNLDGRLLYSNASGPNRGEWNTARCRLLAFGRSQADCYLLQTGVVISWPYNLQRREVSVIFFFLFFLLKSSVRSDHCMTIGVPGGGGGETVSPAIGRRPGAPPP